MPTTNLIAPRRFALASLFVILALASVLGAAQSASAADHCVGTHPMCAGPNNYPATPAGIQSALIATNNNTNFAGPDNVYIGSGTYTMTTTIQVSPNADLAIIGEGAGSTILEAGITNISNLGVFNTGLHQVTVSGLTSRSIGYAAGSAIAATNVDLSNVELEVLALSSGVRGFYGNGTSSISDSKITLTGASATGVYSDDSLTVSDTLIESTDGTSYAINTSGNGDTRTVERTTFRNVRRGVSMDSGTLNISDSFIQLSTISGSGGISAENSNDCTTCVIDLTAENVTVVGTGANAFGISTGATGSDGIAETGTAVIRNSLVHLSGSNGAALRCTQTGDSTTASMNSSYVAAESAKITRTGTCAGADSNQLDTTSVPPTFTFTAVGDYRPAAGSPVIDAGDPAEVVGPGDEDADGLDRLIDGNADLTARIDIGAHEFQAAQPPSSAQLTASPDPANVNQSIAFTALAKEPDNGSVTYAWDFGDSTNGSGANPSHAYTGPGTYTVTVVATDNEGQQSTTTDTVQVTSGPPTTPTSVVSDQNDGFAYRGDDIVFSASGSTDPNGDDVDYKWTFTGGGVATTEADGDGVTRQADSMVNGSGPTIFTATARAVDIYGEESAPVSATVTIYNRMPTIDAILKSADTAYRGEDLTFTMDVTDVENDVMTSSWDLDDGQPATPYDNEYSMTRSYSTVGVKTISLSLRDSYYLQAGPGEVEDTATTTVNILNRDPVPGAIQHTGSLLVSDPQTFSISATESEGDAVSYKWDFGDGTSTTAKPEGAALKTYSSPGTYTVTATVLDDQGAAVIVQRTVTVAARQAVIKVGKPTKSFWPRNKGFALRVKSPLAFIPITTTEPVELRITLARVKGGYVKGKSCVKRKVGKKRCALKLAGSQRIDLTETRSNLGFGAKWAGKKLPAGTYQVTLTPQDGGPAKTVNIKVLKSKP